MKKVLIMALCFLLLIATDAVAQYKYRDIGGVAVSSDCDTAAYYPIGKLCQDSDDGKLYKGTGAAVVEIAAGSSGDVTAAGVAQSWGNGSDPVVWTYSVSGITPTLTATADQIAIDGTLALGTNNLTMTGSLGATGAGKLTKGWFTDLEITNLPSINGTSIHTSPTFTTSILPQASTATIGSSSAEWGGLYLGDSKIIYGQADQSNTLTSSSTGWTAALNLSAAAFVPTSAANAEGEIGFNAASHAYSLYANAEDLSITATADKWTIASGTSATVTITPNTTITGQLTMTANPRIYDGDSHHLTLDVADLSADATLVLGSNTNNITLTNGTAAVDIAAGATLNVDTSLTVDTAAVTLKGKSGGSTITLPTALDLDETHVDGKLCAYTASGTKIVCDQDPAAGAGDLKADGTVPMTGALTPTVAGGETLGTALLPFSSIFLGDAATNNITLTGTSAGAITVTLPSATGTLALLDSPTFTTTLGLPAALSNAAATTWTAKDNEAQSFSIGSTGKDDILAVVTTDDSEGVTMSGTLAVTGAITATGGVTGVASGNIANTLADAAGDMIYATADDTWAKLGIGTATQILQTNSGATAPEWTSTLSVTGIDLTAGTFNIPNGTTALNTGAGRIYFNTTSKAFSIGDGSSSYYAPTSLAPLSFTTGGTTARTVTLPNADATLLYSGGALGTPSGGTLTNATGLPVATGISGLGTNVATALAVNIGSAGAPVLFNGAGGTPTSLNLSNAVMNSGTTLPETCTVGQIFQDTDADTNGSVYFCRATDTWKDIDDDGGEGGMATTDIDTSAEVLGIVTDETGSASGTPLLVFNQAPRIDNIELGAATDTTIARSAAGVVTIEGATILTNTVPAVVDGHAAANLTAASMSDPRCTVTNYGQSAEDVAVTLPTAAANLSCLFTVGTAQSGNKWGVRAGTNDKIYLIAAAGTIGAGDDNGYARMTAAQVGQSFACWSFTTGSGAYDWQCKAISIGSSTFAAN